jgi:tetratricopeptide (TPR) repeat protein
VLAANGKPTDALKSYQAALAIRTKLAEANPSDSEFQRDLAASYNNHGLLLKQIGKPADALKSLEAALAIRRKLADANPLVSEFQRQVAETRYNIDTALIATGKPADALRSYRAVLAIQQKLADANPSVNKFQSDLATFHDGVAHLLREAGKPADALESLEKGLAIRQKLADANPSASEFESDLAGSHNNIGTLLLQTGKPADALKCYQAALAIRKKLAREQPESPDFASELGGSLNNVALIDMHAKRFMEARDTVRQAIEAQRKALASNPAHPTYRRFMAKHLTLLIAATRALGEFEGLALAQRQLVELHETDPAMAAVDARLKAIVKGEQQPKDVGERLQLAQRAHELTRYAASARLWQEAFKAEPRLGDDRRAGHRYNAACAAALAGCGQGKDDPPPSADQKVQLRRQAFDWLTTDLGAWAKELQTANKDERSGVVKSLEHWQQDPDLAGIRDDAALAKLAEAERAAIRKLWGEVDALLKKASRP